MLVSIHIYSLKDTVLPECDRVFFPTRMFNLTNEYTVKSI
ncbi:hypothetical protein M565_ctg1P1266 [Vibrio cyclitrophicus FF75]|nr:hypothetical protein M565_ctg1P1266 [Vibrio cyclitrophicus FF75]